MRERKRVYNRNSQRKSDWKRRLNVKRIQYLRIAAREYQRRKKGSRRRLLGAKSYQELCLHDEIKGDCRLCLNLKK